MAVGQKRNSEIENQCQLKNIKKDDKGRRKKEGRGREAWAGKTEAKGYRRRKDDHSRAGSFGSVETDEPEQRRRPAWGRAAAQTRKTGAEKQRCGNGRWRGVGRAAQGRARGKAGKERGNGKAGREEREKNAAGACGLWWGNGAERRQEKAREGQAKTQKSRGKGCAAAVRQRDGG